MAPEATERRLAAILCADVVGYSRLMGADEEGTLAVLKAHRAEVIGPSIAGHHGRLVKETGDGFLAEFPSVVEAVRCALDVQRGMAARNAGLPEERQMRLRVGVNLGDVIADGGDLYGDGVNVAARLEALAPPGGICISRAARDQIRDKLDVGLEDMGEIPMKNIARPVRAFRLVETRPQSEAPADDLSARPSVAVLPFVNMSGDPEQEYFSDGITEDIITGLSCFRSIFVIARNSTFTYKGRAVKCQDVAAELGVAYVVEGSVRKIGNRVRITAQLVHAHNGVHVWAQRYDRDLGDIFAVQDEVTRAIVAGLAERVEAADLDRVRRKPTERMDAYELYLRGREHHHRFTKEDNAEGIRCLERAVELDPSFAQAWAWLSCVVGQAWTRGYMPDRSELWTRCVAAARRALELDDQDSECHRILCEINLMQRKHGEAEHHHERAIALNPNDPRLLVQRGYLLTYLGRAEEGIEWVQNAIRLDPLRPENYSANLGIVLHAARRYAEAVQAFHRLPQLQLGHHAYLAACHARLRDEAAARERATRILELEPEFTIRKHVASLLYRDRADVEHYAEGLRMAGLPD